MIKVLPGKMRYEWFVDVILVWGNKCDIGVPG